MANFKLTQSEVETILVNPLFKRACKVRGIVPDFWERGLSERQAATVSILANPGDTRTDDQKLAQLGVSREELNGWYQIPEFKRTITERAQANLGNLDTEAYAALAKNIQNKNQRAIEYYFQLTGKHETPEVINIKRAMRMIEDTVKELLGDRPEVLQAISTRFNEIRDDL